jgi:hypothetical protein
MGVLPTRSIMLAIVIVVYQEVEITTFIIPIAPAEKD